MSLWQNSGEGGGKGIFPGSFNEIHNFFLQSFDEIYFSEFCKRKKSTLQASKKNWYTCGTIAGQWKNLRKYCTRTTSFTCQIPYFVHDWLNPICNFKPCHSKNPAQENREMVPLLHVVNICRNTIHSWLISVKRVFTQYIRSLFSIPDFVLCLNFWINNRFFF